MNKKKRHISRKYLKHIRRKNRQIVILLGAGAAYSWGGVTSKDIKNIFIDSKRFKTEDGTTIGEFVFDILDKFYDEEKHKANFETFLAVIEEYLNYVMASTTQGKTPYNTSFLPVILELKKFLDKKNVIKQRRCCYDLFIHYINLIINKIDEYNSKVLSNGFEEINGNLIKFTKYFLVRNYSVKFYTTNYDSLIPQILSKKCKIYEGHYGSLYNYKRFIYDLSRFRQAHLSHFNLHGSIFLHDVMINGYESVYFTKKQLLSISYGRSVNSGNPGEPLFFSPIISGQNKTQRSFNKPFNLGFNAFINDCNNCHALITVGYSFSDPHINSILSTFISWDKVKFLNITKMDRIFSPTMEDANLDSLFPTPLVRKEEDDTWFYDTTERRRIYKKSFEGFLKCKLNWEWLHL
jgi:hypothetical protein